MARLPELVLFAETHRLPLITIRDLIAYIGGQQPADAAQAA
jgi:3,4-dihydroxy 2-butanone 4-phosphate synthase